MSRRFDDVESQVKRIAARHWKSVNGQMVRSAATELKKGRTVIFGNTQGCIYCDSSMPITDWEAVKLNNIGLHMNGFNGIVIELNLTEIKIMNQMWSGIWPEDVKYG